MLWTILAVVDWLLWFVSKIARYEELSDLDLVYDAVGEKEAFSRVKQIKGLVKQGTNPFYIIL